MTPAQQAALNAAHALMGEHFAAHVLIGCEIDERQNTHYPVNSSANQAMALGLLEIAKKAILESMNRATQVQ